MPAIYRLDQPTSLAEGGGKWLGLTRLHALGAPVPPALCVGATAFRELLSSQGLRPVIEELGTAEDARLPELSERIRQRIASAPLEPKLASLLRTARATLWDGPVAVRSSATAEDREDASFAGQYDTLLDVRGESQLIAALTTCWASAFAERAVVYRRNAGLSHADVAMAVVIQEMVAATISGVAFTQHPVDARPIMLFEACRGLGEALVSGSINPDRFEVSRSGNCVESLASDADTGLAADRLLRMRDLFLQLEAAFGFPLDLEWSWRDDALFVLQARPITTSVARPQSIASSTPGALYGAAASPGQAEGTARVLLDPDQDELDPGDILVTPFTDPSFMRHFRMAAALVMEHGGMLSHGAIVARECGIPAVIGVGDATTRIATGVEIRVDGNAGEVTLL